LDTESRILSGVDIFIDAGNIVALGAQPVGFEPDNISRKKTDPSAVFRLLGSV